MKPEFRVPYRPIVLHRSGKSHGLAIVNHRPEETIQDGVVTRRSFVFRPQNNTSVEILLAAFVVRDPFVTTSPPSNCPLYGPCAFNTGFQPIIGKSWNGRISYRGFGMSTPIEAATNCVRDNFQKLADENKRLGDENKRLINENRRLAQEAAAVKANPAPTPAPIPAPVPIPQPSLANERNKVLNDQLAACQNALKQCQDANGQQFSKCQNDLTQCQTDNSELKKKLDGCENARKILEAQSKTVTQAGNTCTANLAKTQADLTKAWEANTNLQKELANAQAIARDNSAIDCAKKQSAKIQGILAQMRKQLDDAERAAQSTTCPPPRPSTSPPAVGVKGTGFVGRQVTTQGSFAANPRESAAAAAGYTRTGGWAINMYPIPRKKHAPAILYRPAPAPTLRPNLRTAGAYHSTTLHSVQPIPFPVRMPSYTNYS